MKVVSYTMEDTPSPADRLTAAARAARLRREAEATARASRKRTIVIAAVSTPVVLFSALVIGAVISVSNRPVADVGDWRAKVGQATPAELADQPKLAKPDSLGVGKKDSADQATEQPQPQATTDGNKWTYEQAMKEACEAGRQYREDVDLNGMRPSEAEYEAKSYSQYLADNSPAPRKALYDRIEQGLWMDSCF